MLARGGAGHARPFPVSSTRSVALGCEASSCGSSTSAGFPAARTSSFVPSRGASSSRGSSASGSTTTTCCASAPRGRRGAYPPADDDDADRRASLGAGRPRVPGVRFTSAARAPLRGRLSAPLPLAATTASPTWTRWSTRRVRRGMGSAPRELVREPQLLAFRVRRADSRAPQAGRSGDRHRRRAGELLTISASATRGSP